MIAMLAPRIPPPTARGLYEWEREATRAGGTAAIPTDVGTIDPMLQHRFESDYERG
jgi:hypothetical protein